MPGGESHGVRSPACVEKLRRQTVAHKEKHQKIRPGNDFPRAGFSISPLQQLAHPGHAPQRPPGEVAHQEHGDQVGKRRAHLA